MIPARALAWLQALMRRYFWPELTAIIGTLLSGWITYANTHSIELTAAAASVGETISYYGFIIGRATVWEFRHYQHGHTGWRRAGQVSWYALRNALEEHLIAEPIDFLLVRPLCMYLALQGSRLLVHGWPGNDALTGTPALILHGAGLVAGKLVADIVFYAIAYTTHHWWDRRRKRQLAERPYLIMNLDQVTRDFCELQEAMPEVRLHYAVKCNPEMPLLRHLHRLGCRFEIASIGELKRLLRAGVNPAEVLFSNPTKPASHIEQAWKQGVRWFAADGVEELDKLKPFAGVKVCLRLATSVGDSDVPSEGKFGVSPEEVLVLAQQAIDRGLQVGGLSFHVGSQMTRPAVWATSLKQCGELMRLLHDNHGIKLELVDIGGGFPARYANTIAPPLHEYGRIITEAAAEHLPYSVQLVAEPGRVLVAAAGTLVGKVISVVQRGATRTAHVTFGAFQGVAEALETGCSLAYPASDSRRSPEKRTFQLTGPTCDSQDTVMTSVQLSADLRMGDEIRLGQSGAYCTAYGTNFNDFEPPYTVYQGD